MDFVINIIWFVGTLRKCLPTNDVCILQTPTVYALKKCPTVEELVLTLVD